MMTHFKIDGVLIPAADVLSGKVPTRYPLGYLQVAADSRKWDGKPHVTDLFVGIRQLWLKEKFDFSVDPEDAAYRIIGTNAHAKLETKAHELDEKEISLETDEIQGRSDLFGPMMGEMAITDYKVVGSYKVQQCLGIYSEDEPILEDGKPVYFKTGARAGQPKTHKVTKMDPKKAYIKDFTRQLNIYRVLAKKVLGIEAKRLFIFAIVRDGGTIAATQRSVTQKTYTFEIPLADDEKVWNYIKARSAAIIGSMSGDIAPPLCSNEENWDGRKCQGYCEVAGACRAIGDNPFLKGEPIAEPEEQA